MSVVCACITGYPQPYLLPEMANGPCSLSFYCVESSHCLQLSSLSFSCCCLTPSNPLLGLYWIWTIVSCFPFQAHHQYQRFPKATRPNPFQNSLTPSPIPSNPSPLVAEKGRNSLVCVCHFKPRGSASASPRAVHMQLSPVALLSAMNELDSVNGTH